MRLAVVVVAGCGFAPSSATTSDGGVVHDTIALDGDGSGSGSAAPDFDHDGIPDDLDFCPHIANPANPDADGDGVGDECDPRPGLIDKRVYWSSFDNPNEINGWLAVGSWSVQSGEAVQGSSNNITTYLQVPIVVNRAYVAASLVSGALSGGSAPAVGVRVTTTANNHYGCGLYRSMGNINADASSGASANAKSQWATNDISGTPIAIVQNLNTPTNVNGCTFPGTSISLTSAFVSGEATPPAGHVELSTVSATAAYEYLFIVDTSPS